MSMLIERRISITAKTVVDDTEIASFGAVLNVENNDISFYNKQIDKEACKNHRDVVRADQAAFEDFAYKLQEEVSRD